MDTSIWIGPPRTCAARAIVQEGTPRHVLCLCVCVCVHVCVCVCVCVYV